MLGVLSRSELRFRGGFQRIWVFVSEDASGRVVSQYSGCWPVLKTVFSTDFLGDWPSGRGLL